MAAQEVQEVHNDRNPQVASILSLIPGLGQFYNRQWPKGVAFLAIAALFAYEVYAWGWEAIRGFITLGQVPREDHSLFLMIGGTLQIIVTVIFVIFYTANIRDAYRTAKAWNEGKRVPSTLKEILTSLYQDGFPYLLIIPAYLAMTFAIITPVLVTIFMAFMNYDFRNMPPANLLDWVGLENFRKIFFLSTFRDAFVSVLSWTIIWTLAASTLQIALGILTAVVMHQPYIRGKRVFGVIFLLPWAVPAFITIMTFSNMFNDSVGAINTQVIPFIERFLPFLDIGLIPWKTDPFWTKTAIILIQGWLGFPYIYVMTTSILQSIPDDMYEAARIDGAGAWKQFTSITFPTIMSVAAPVFITQYTGNFNNFSMIYLFNEGGPGSAGGGAGRTDILISWIYKLTTGNSPQFSLAAALTLIVSVIVIGVSLIVFKRTGAFQMEDD